MSSLKLSLLGMPCIERDGVSLKFDTRKNVALIAYLAVTGQSHSREALVTLLWPELEPSRARAGLRRNLSMLRRALGGEWLVIEREAVGSDPNADFWLDVDQFRSLLRAWRGHGHPQEEICPECLVALAEAVDLYRGDFMAGFSLRDSANFDEWQFFQTESLRQELASALDRLVLGHGARGECERAISYAQRWLALDPLHEPVHRHLMQLYAQAGQRAAALRQYEECVRILEAELGLAPSEETTSLCERIRTRSLDAEESRSPTSLPRHNLPVQLTPFVGREAVLAEIAVRLQDPACRLLTLVGPGGSGKTRLALEAAAAQVDRYAQGAYFVSLAPLQSVEAIVPTVAEALGFSFYSGGAADQQLLDYLRQKAVLLIMDNFEHLLEGVGLVTDILKTAPAVSILATSRASLKVPGEYLFPVAGMDLPPLPSPAGDGGGEGRYSAVELFLQGARRSQPAFELTADNLADVTRICRLVEGLPLGILLAAAWVEMLTPAEIAKEIERSLDFLETDLHDVPARQRSMRAAFDYSWRLLTEREREALQGLSVFRGGFTRHAAQAVAGASLRDLMALVNKSLLHPMPTGRCEITHKLLRQYAAGKLDGSPEAGQAARDRHCAYYVDALQGWTADMKGTRQQAALEEIRVDRENARAAWNWAVERGQVERIDRAVEGLCRLYEWRGRYQEGESACRAAAERLSATASGDQLRVLARILAWQGVFSRRLGRSELANQLLRRSLALLEGLELADREPVLGLPRDSRPEKAFVLLQMGYAAIDSDREAARQLCEQSLALYQALGDRWGAAHALAALGLVARFAGAYDGAKRLSEEGLAIRRALGDPRGIADSLMELGWAALYQGQLEEGERLVREGMAICQEIGDRASIATGLSSLGSIFILLGKYAEARSLKEESLAICDDLGLRAEIAFSNTSLCHAQMHLGNYGPARTHGQRGLGFFREIGSQWGIGLSLCYLGWVALAEGAYAEAQEYLQESAAADEKIGQRDHLGGALAALGYAARGLGQPSQAREYLSGALQMASETENFVAVVHALSGIALLLTDRGQVERATELYTLASRHPFVANSRWFEDVVGKQIAARAASLSPEVVAAAQERGRGKDLEVTVKELLAEFGEGRMPDAP